MIILPLLALLVAPPQTPANQKAHKVVAQAIATLGGGHYLQANERSGTGRAYSFNSSGELNDPGTVFWAYYRDPADERIELTKKRDVVYIYAHGQGWEITYKGVAPILRKQLTQYQDTSAHSLDVILKQWAADPQTLMIYQGVSQLDQAQIESVSFTTQSGDNATVDFSLTTHLPARVSWRKDDPDTGGHYVESVIYGNWAQIGAIYTPLMLDHYEGDQRLDQRYFTSVSFAPFSDALFTPKPLGKH
ncbi:MAG TPA: hypothetical protein VN515_01965 [Terriglobales bacterium]|nr:hypothetical protein [Terriglobales bacterium]